MADVGSAGVLVVLGLPWNSTAVDAETGLYWVRRDQPIRHLLQRIRDLRAVPLPDGFAALFTEDFTSDRKPDDPQDIFVLWAQGKRLALYRFARPGLSGPGHFVSLGGHRFAATFGNHKVVIFDMPDQ